MAAIHKGDDDFSNYADSIMAAPSHRWIVMCNGVTSQRIIDYDFDQAQEETETWESMKMKICQTCSLRRSTL